MNMPITEGQLIAQIRASILVIHPGFEGVEDAKSNALEKLAALDNLLMTRVMQENPLRTAGEMTRAVLGGPVDHSDALRGCINLGTTAIRAPQATHAALKLP